jgi:hypothetical protein
MPLQVATLPVEVATMPIRAATLALGPRARSNAACSRHPVAVRRADRSANRRRGTTALPPDRPDQFEQRHPRDHRHRHGQQA